MSELSMVLPFEKFKIAFEKFLEQSEKNIASDGKSHGMRKPFGVSPINNQSFGGKLCVDGCALGQQYGYGRQSDAPYFNWHVVSIYYVVSEQKIKLGIEKSRYRYLDKLSNFSYESFKNRKTPVAVFYSNDRASIDYQILYEKFMELSAKVLSIGL